MTNHTDRWLSGRKRPPAKWVTGVKPVLGFESRSVRHFFVAALVFGTTGAIPVQAAAQTGKTPPAKVQAATPLESYLKLRKSYGIRRAAGVEALAALVGKRILEISGVVKGTFRIGDKITVLLETEAGPDDTYVVDARSVPDWLSGGEIPARLLVQATRANEYAAVTCRLIGVAPEEALAAIEAKEDRAAAALAKSAVVRRATPSRSMAKASVPGKTPGRQWTLPASQVLPHYVAYVRKANPKLSVREADRIARGIIGFSLKYGVDARLIVAMVMCESEFDPMSTSHSGAQGLGQLMPGTARDLGVRNPYDTVENLYGTVKLMRANLDSYAKGRDSYNSLVLAVAAYNAGPGAVARHGGVPPYKETQRYVRKVIALYRKLCGM